MRRIAPHTPRRLALIAWPAFVLFLVLASAAIGNQCPLRQGAEGCGVCQERNHAASLATNATVVATAQTAAKLREAREVDAPTHGMPAAQIATLSVAPKTSPPA